MVKNTKAPMRPPTSIMTIAYPKSSLRLGSERDWTPEYGSGSMVKLFGGGIGEKASGERLGGLGAGSG